MKNGDADDTEKITVPSKVPSIPHFTYKSLACSYKPTMWPSGVRSDANLPCKGYFTGPSSDAPSIIASCIEFSMHLTSKHSSGEYPVESAATDGASYAKNSHAITYNNSQNIHKGRTFSTIGTPVLFSELNSTSCGVF